MVGVGPKPVSHQVPSGRPRRRVLATLAAHDHVETAEVGAARTGQVVCV